MIARLDARTSKEREQSVPSEWDWLFWLFGLPTKPGGEDWARFPQMTVMLIVATVVLSIIFPLSIDGLILTAGGNPFTTWVTRYGWYNILYLISFPLSNLVINLYFSIFFGASVENKVGPYHLLTLFLFPTLVGLVFSLSTGFHMPSLIQASGGVAAIMVFFAFAFPKRKIFGVSAVAGRFTWWPFGCFLKSFLRRYR